MGVRESDDDHLRLSVSLYLKRIRTSMIGVQCPIDMLDVQLIFKMSNRDV